MSAAIFQCSWFFFTIQRKFSYIGALTRRVVVVCLFYRLFFRKHLIQGVLIKSHVLKHVLKQDVFEKKSMPNVKFKCLGQTTERIEEQRERGVVFSSCSRFEGEIARKVGVKNFFSKRSKNFDHVRLFQSSFFFKFFLILG